MLNITGKRFRTYIEVEELLRQCETQHEVRQVVNELEQRHDNGVLDFLDNDWPRLLAEVNRITTTMAFDESAGQVERPLFVFVAPDGHNWQIYEDGRYTGFPEGTIVVNNATSLINSLRCPT